MLITSPIIFSRFYLITASRIIPKFIYKKCICDTRTQNNSSTIWTWAFDTIFCVVNHQTLIKTKQTCVRVRVSTQIKPFVIRLHSCKVCLYFTLFFFLHFYCMLGWTILSFISCYILGSIWWEYIFCQKHPSRVEENIQHHILRTNVQ